ncbi:TPCN2 [Bugula neritina]|uniref:TPCN2 n=1 Tax=Bugula neritina TaxID=10212 RepID=A0A7J7KQ84_BUGNE|nr:TPCN2 [Bugula neritina]
MMPAYKENRFSAFYFIVFLMIGLYCLMNMLTAVIYNQFRGYFKASMTSSLFRRRLGIRAAFEMLRNRQLLLERVSVSVQIQSDTGVPKQAVLSTLPKVRISEAARCRVQSALSSFPEYITSDQLQEIFDSYNKKSSADSQVPPIPWLPENTVLFKLQRILVHPMFGYFGCGVVLSNVIAISVLFSTQYDKSLESSHSAIHMMNVCFACYYVLEKMLLVWANGKKRFIKSKAELFDTVILFALVVLEVVFLSRYGSEVFLSTSSSSLDSTHLAWQLVKTINLLIILRLIRLLPQIQALYYLFAILGMELFERKIVAPSNTTGESEYSCGTYEQLGYWANNFDDFAAALVVLWNIMVVNNWHVFLDVYSRKVSPWSQLYFIVFWILSVIDRSTSFTSTYSTTNPLSVHEMFRPDVEEPSEDELLAELQNNEYIYFQNL